MAHDPFGGMSSYAAHGPRKFNLVDVFIWGTILANITVKIMLQNLISSGLSATRYLILLSKIIKKSYLRFLRCFLIVFMHYSAPISLNAFKLKFNAKGIERLAYAFVTSFFIVNDWNSLLSYSKRLVALVWSKDTNFSCPSFMTIFAFKVVEIFVRFVNSSVDKAALNRPYTETKLLELEIYER